MKNYLKRLIAVIIAACIAIGCVGANNVDVFAASSTKIFEETIKGATAWSVCNLKIYESGSTTSKVVKTISPGTRMKITSSDESSKTWWTVSCTVGGKTYKGWVQHAYCMINLPDVETSIVYNITNNSSSIYKSSGYNLAGVTGKNLYSSSKVYSSKSYKGRSICPVTYSTAKKIAKAEKSALKDGYCLKIYDAYRPYSVSKKIRDSLNNLYKSNSTVKAGIDYSYGASGTRYTWGQGWFLAQSISSHNTGSAIDVTLCNSKTKKESTMPTKMHELSTKAIKYYSGSCSKSSTNYSKEMNAVAKKMDKYFTDAGMTTLASEWWHFQDQSSHNLIKNISGFTSFNF
jgi:D-alanyl-D-alanine dipeptidase